MEENKNYLKYYDLISEEIKYLAKSFIRIKILSVLYDKPLNMKDLNTKTGLSYSSISSNMHNMELRGFVYRCKNKYYLTSSTRLKIEHMIELGKITVVLEDYFNIFENHIVDKIPKESISDFHLLDKAEIIESDMIDVYKTTNYIEKALSSANEARCILPFFHESFNEKLNELVLNRKKVEILVPEAVLEKFEEKSDVLRLRTYHCENNFLLVITDGMMILGLFKDDSVFDQNRILVSEDKNSIRWAKNLFKIFKNNK